MNSQHPKKSSMPSNAPSSTPFEYFLYAAIIVETALAALVYKAIFRNAELAHFSVYFAIFYFVFLAWAIAQLNALHRDRHPKPAHVEAPLQSDPASLASHAIEPRAPESELEPRETEDTHPPFGLTRPQLVILVVVFATAVATFSCALRLLR